MILQAHHISKTFQYPQKVVVFTDLSLTVEQGESVAIMGRSGEGKTTLLHILGLLEAPDSGTVSIAGDTASAPLLRNRHIGFIFQSFNLLEDFTALDNVLMPARIARKPLDLEYGRHLLDQVGLSDRALFPAKLLSGGEKQRVAIARALCNDPDLILADEPSGNLDHANADAIGALLFSLVRQKNKSLILVTHNPDLASLCEKRYQLSGGQLTNK
jgi:lipoprotein-releasing system ATP-binding protein